jgi:SAM-dependent methyltransferase
MDGYFDCVAVVGGLHHIHPHVGEAIGEIHRVLKKGGYLCFVEPHSGSLPDILRRYWYRHDKLFMKNEASLDFDGLKMECASRFRVIREKYGGGIAYLLVLNSMVFRVPPKIKSFYAPALLALESFTDRLACKSLSCFAISQWQKI